MWNISIWEIFASVFGRETTEKARMAGLSEKEVFDILSTMRRRRLIRVLAQNGEMDFSDIARRVAIMEYGDEALPARHTNPAYKRIYISLRQNHLEDLDDIGVVEFDSDENYVEPYPVVDALYEMLGEADERFSSE